MMDWTREEDLKTLESVTISGVLIKKGDRVRLQPQRPADIMDVALKGKIAIVEAIECDYEDRIQLAVVMEDDPGWDLCMMRQPGHRFFFSTDEVEPVARSRGKSNEP